MDDIEFPADELGDEIEYAAGEGAYSEDDRVKAALCGKKKIDAASRTISIKPAFNTPIKIKEGLELYGMVENVAETHAAIRLTYDRDGKERYDLSNDYSMLRIEDVKAPGQYIKSMRDALKAGDIVRVKVLKIKRGGIDVTMRGEGLGVIKAYCSKCREPLALKGNRLFCSKCNKHEMRKLGSPYIEVIG